MANSPPTGIPLVKPVPFEHKFFYSIEYPGFVAPQSVSKAIDRLGGPQIVADTFRRGLKIDLKLKDNEPYAHPPNGQVVTTQNLVMKVVRRRRKGQGPIEDTESGPRGQFTVQVLGLAQKTLRFRTPVDFQYLPPKDDPVVKLRDAMMRLDASYILSYRLPEEKEDFTLTPEERQERGFSSSSNARIFPPPLFSRYDMPINYNFKPNPLSTQQTVVDKVTGETTTRLVNTTKRADGHPITIRWKDPTPISIGPEREASRHLARNDLVQKLEEKFQERPIWTRLGLLNQMAAHDVRSIHNAKSAWAMCSYVFQEGPWRDTVIKIGYDPRQDPQAFKYQIVALRNVRNTTFRPSVLQAGGTQSGTQRDVQSHTFDGKTPRSAGTFQFCDITDPLIRRYLDDPRHRTDTCTDHDGWLNHVTSERIKALMKFKHQRLSDTGVGPTDEDCATLLAPDDQYVKTISRKIPTAPRERKKAKAKINMPEEEMAARRLELALFSPPVTPAIVDTSQIGGEVEAARSTIYRRLGAFKGLSKLSSYPQYSGRHFSSAPAEGTSSSHTINNNVKPGSKRKWLWVGSFSGLVGALFIWDHYYNARTLSRNTRTVWNGLKLVLDYKLNYDPNNLDKMNGVHERSAARLLHVCRKNGGLYVKAGQAIGIQVAILPKPYHALAQMFDGADPISLEAVREVIHEELGMWPEEIFAEFDPKPVGSASIAQVHRAKLHTGETVAVKVQRPDIRKHASWDLLAFRILMQIYERVFELPLSFASQYISDQIELETHFDHERANTERIRNHVLRDAPKHLQGGVAHVPAVYGNFCTPRLLVMEYIDGAVRMTDVDSLENKLKLDVNEVMNSVCEVFAAQVFRWGFINADPHPSNVLIRRHPDKPTTHQVVLIDHGLSISLPPTFREQYLTLWQCLFENDVEGLKAICKGWGIDIGADAMAAQMMGGAILLQGWSHSGKRSATDVPRHGHHGMRPAVQDAAGQAITEEEKQKRDMETQRAMKATVKRFLENYELIPKELIFLGRSMRIIQANNQALGSPVDRISILAKGAADGLYDMRMRPPVALNSVHTQTQPPPQARGVIGSGSWLGRFYEANIGWLKFRIAIAGMGVAFGRRGLFWGLLWVQEVWQSLSGTLGLGGGHSRPAGNEGDLMQEQVVVMAKDFGIEIDEKTFRG